jgi:CheY-like chemotaxis protein
MSKKLLLISNRRGIARTIRSVAPELGLNIVVLNDRAQAVARVTETAPDVVILDLTITADELIELLRSVLHIAADAKILIAARADDPSARVTEGMARFHAGERLSFLRRPLTRKRIIAALQAILGGVVVPLALSAVLSRWGIA